MNRFLSALLLLSAACGSAPKPAVKAVEMRVHAPASGLLSPATCGALPNDANDDRECIQETIDAACAAGGGTVLLDEGVWKVTRPASIPGSLDAASLRLECPRIKLAGVGPATVLEMMGDGYAADWALIRVSADHTTSALTYDVEVSDMTLSSGSASNFNAQTHLLLTSLGPVRGVSFHDLWFNLPAVAAPAVSPGDCIRILGETGATIQDVNLSRFTTIACARSGISFQREFYGFTAESGIFRGVAKTPLDFEATGSGNFGQVTLRGLLISGHGVSISSTTGIGTDVVLADSVIEGGVGIYNIKRASVTGNVIYSVQGEGDGALYVKAESSEITITGNTIRRLAESVTGPVVKISAINNKFPSRVVLDGNEITNDVDGNLVEVDSAKDVTLSDNDLVFAGPTATTYDGVLLKPNAGDVAKVQVISNRFAGALRYVLKVAGNPFSIGEVQAVGNMSSGSSTAGLRCENTSKFTKPVVHASYDYSGTGSATSGCSGATIVTQSP